MTTPPAEADSLQPWSRTSPFLDAGLGPLQVRSGTAEFTLTVAGRHTNSREIAHGGMLATLADLALGHTLAGHLPARQSLSTVSLSLDFITAAHVGDRLETRTDIIRIGSTAAFSRCLVTADGDRPVLRASGVFAVRDR